MHKRGTYRRPSVLLRLVASVFVGIGLAHSAKAQLPLSAPRPALPARLVESPFPIQVFPEGDFPATPSALEGGIPAPVAEPVADNPPPPSPRPGALPLPNYYYEESYYDQPGLGAKPIADYAPVGYEEREYQDAPGAPEYLLLTPPPRVAEEERNRFVTRGMFPGSYLVPGTDTSFRVRGFVRATGLYDFDPIGSRDDFVTNTIPVPQTTGQNTNVSVRVSRLALETWTPTPLNQWTVHTFVEGDFFNGPAQAAGGGGNPFRLRFAFVDFGYFRVGQQNTVFMDSSSFPSMVNFAGPRGLTNLRRPTVRMTVPLTDNLFWAGGIEQPFSDITTNGQGVNVQDIPDFATHLRYEADNGHVQLSSVIRAMEFRPTGGDVNRQVGWGVSGSTNFHPWAILMGTNAVRASNPTGLERSRFLLQYTCGWGITRYLRDTLNQGLDGQVDPNTGSFATPWTVGWSASYEHWFNEKWLANVNYSEVQVGSNSGQPGSTYTGAKALATSLWYIPIRNMSIAVEYIWGERENLDAERGRANRLSALLQYNF